MKQNNTNAWGWVPSLYFAEGLPYVLVVTVSTFLYKDLGLSNAQIAFYTGWLYLPWVIKPFWSPIVDTVSQKRTWIVATQLTMGAALASLGFTLTGDIFLKGSLVFFWLLAFSSATHDIAADGFYMIGLEPHQQSFFVGFRNAAYRLAMIAGQGGLVFLAGYLNHKTGLDTASAWKFTFVLAGVVYASIGIYHYFQLPKAEDDTNIKAQTTAQALQRMKHALVSFFAKKEIGIALSFILLYRLGEAQLGRMSGPFLKDALANGGLGFSNEQVGFIYGTIGVLGLIIGGIAGGVLVSRFGLKRMLWPMILLMNLPNLAYVYMALVQPQNDSTIMALISIEQLGYGFGFTAFTMYLLYFADGPNKTSHFALATGFMALGMMLPGMISGSIADAFGYKMFFVWVCICTIPGFIIAKYLRFPPDFGRKST